MNKSFDPDWLNDQIIDREETIARLTAELEAETRECEKVTNIRDAMSISLVDRVKERDEARLMVHDLLQQDIAHLAIELTREQESSHMLNIMCQEARAEVDRLRKLLVEAAIPIETIANLYKPQIVNKRLDRVAVSPELYEACVDARDAIRKEILDV